jgi:hypothetical protein
MKLINAVLLALTLSLLNSGAIAAPLVVSPGNMDGWAFYTTNSSGIVGTGAGIGMMVNGPGTPPLGTGSAQLAPASGDGSVQLRNSDWAGTRIDALTSLSYSTFATAWNGQQLPYVTIWIDNDGNGSKDDRLWFEPAYSAAGAGNSNPSPQADPALNTWQTWNLLSGMWYSDNHFGPGSNAVQLSAYLALHPDATIVNDAAQAIGGIRITSGFASAGDTFNAYVDNFTIGTKALSITYDFELQDATPGTEVPEPASLAVWSLIAAAGSVYGWRRRTAA